MAVEPFATGADYSARGYDASVWDSEQILDMKLAEASRYVRSMAKTIDERIANGELDSELVKDVVCTMVARTEPIADVPMGAESTQFGVDIFQRSVKFGGGGASQIYLSKEDKRKLGISSQKAFSVDLAPVTGGGVGDAFT